MVCNSCGSPHVCDPLGLCLSCTNYLRQEFYASLEQLQAYPAAWAAFQEWEAQRPLSSS
jgi:hypothetical protein